MVEPTEHWRRADRARALDSSGGWRPIAQDNIPTPITLYRASQMLNRELEAGERHEPGLLGQMLAHLMANAARVDEVGQDGAGVSGG